MASPARIATKATKATNDRATILLNIFDGTRQLIGAGVKNLLIRIIDGNQKQLFSDFRNGASFQFQVPFFDNFGDRYTVIASADHHKQAGFNPVNISRTLPQAVDLMLLPENGTFRFANASWANFYAKRRIANHGNRT